MLVIWTQLCKAVVSSQSEVRTANASQVALLVKNPPANAS